MTLIYRVIWCLTFKYLFLTDSFTVFGDLNVKKFKPFKKSKWFNSSALAKDKHRDGDEETWRQGERGKVRLSVR